MMIYILMEGDSVSGVGQRGCLLCLGGDWLRHSTGGCQDKWKEIEENAGYLHGEELWNSICLCSLAMMTWTRRLGPVTLVAISTQKGVKDTTTSQGGRSSSARSSLALATAEQPSS